MAIITQFTCMVFLTISMTILVGLITYLKWAFKYWEKKKVPYVEPQIPFGTMANPLKQTLSFGDQSRKQYEEFKAKGHKHVGLFAFASVIYMPIDREYIRNILSRDFNHFVDRGVYYNEKSDPISAHLFCIGGAKWKNLRAKLTPTFTSGKMKMMFQTLIECGNQMKEAMDTMSSEKEPLDIKDVLGRFTTDVIGSCAFGLDCNSFKDPHSEFRDQAKRFFIPTPLENLKAFIGFTCPNLARRLGITITAKGPASFYMNIIRNTVSYRETNNFVRKDFMQLLIDLKNNVKSTDDDDDASEQNGNGITLNELAAQAFVFFIAGYETSSTTMTFCLFELARNPVIQEKVRDEIRAVLAKHGGKITYDAVMDMKYMGQVIDETLRRYPPLPVLNRKCVEDYEIPETGITIEKGTCIVISVLGLHHDAEYFPDPEKFDPERFSDSNKSQIKPFTYMPFGEGPRICIGLRFGLMQTKVGLTVLLKNYTFSLNRKTQIPIKMNPYSYLLNPLGDIWLDVSKVHE